MPAAASCWLQYPPPTIAIAQTSLAAVARLSRSWLFAAACLLLSLAHHFAVLPETLVPWPTIQFRQISSPTLPDVLRGKSIRALFFDDIMWWDRCHGVLWSSRVLREEEAEEQGRGKRRTRRRRGDEAVSCVSSAEFPGGSGVYVLVSPETAKLLGERGPLAGCSCPSLPLVFFHALNWKQRSDWYWYFLSCAHARTHTHTHTPVSSTLSRVLETLS